MYKFLDYHFILQVIKLNYSMKQFIIIIDYLRGINLKYD